VDGGEAESLTTTVNGEEASSVVPGESTWVPETVQLLLSVSPVGMVEPFLSAHLYGGLPPLMPLKRRAEPYWPDIQAGMLVGVVLPEPIGCEDDETYRMKPPATNITASIPIIATVLIDIGSFYYRSINL
jgi:hypothetical protein